MWEERDGDSDMESGDKHKDGYGIEKSDGDPNMETGDA